MKKSILIVLLGAPMVCLFLWILFLCLSQIGAKEVRVFIKGYDPRDLLAGRYLAYQIDWDKTDCKQFEGGVCPKEEFCKKAKWGRECRFYVSELKASLLDDVFRKSRDKGDVFEAVYTYKKGRMPMAKRLLINGEDWQNFIKKR